MVTIVAGPNTAGAQAGDVIDVDERTGLDLLAEGSAELAADARARSLDPWDAEVNPRERE
jgi:hypothetical protein